MIITFDGASCTGKSTLAKLVAKRLGFNFMNSGMIYRAVTYYLLSKNITPNDTNKIDKVLDDVRIAVNFESNTQYVFINDEECGIYASELSVTKNVSQFSQNLKLRLIIEKVQRDFAQSNNCVFEGRDLGSVVFPNADYKFYVVCNIDIRAERRYADLKNDNPNITLQEVKKMLNDRDYNDIHRKVSPLVKPTDSIVIDTSFDTVEESVNKIISYII